MSSKRYPLAEHALDLMASEQGLLTAKWCAQSRAINLRPHIAFRRSLSQSSPDGVHRIIGLRCTCYRDRVSWWQPDVKDCVKQTETKRLRAVTWFIALPYFGGKMSLSGSVQDATSPFIVDLNQAARSTANYLLYCELRARSHWKVIVDGFLML